MRSKQLEGGVLHWGCAFCADVELQGGLALPHMSLSCKSPVLPSQPLQDAFLGPIAFAVE